jgi:hypothetical protein
MWRHICSVKDCRSSSDCKHDAIERSSYNTIQYNTEQRAQLIMDSLLVSNHQHANHGNIDALLL